MQNAKDTFYITLRGRLQTVNPARTMTLRAVTRPGILVSDAEAPMPQPQLDAFAISWTGFQADLELPAILAEMTCEIQYSTAGTQANMGLDRGRCLEEMDYEVLKLLYPYSAQKMNYTVNPAAPMETMVFWSEPEFAAATSVRDRLSRTVKVTVFAFQEAGEQ
jgi:microcompartment protein CcmL/EutN